MPASVEILTKTQEFVRTNVSIFVTLTLSLGADLSRGGRLHCESGIETVQRAGTEDARQPRIDDPCSLT